MRTPSSCVTRRSTRERVARLSGIEHLQSGKRLGKRPRVGGSREREHRAELRWCQARKRADLWLGKFDLEIQRPRASAAGPPVVCLNWLKARRPFCEFNFFART